MLVSQILKNKGSQVVTIDPVETVGALSRLFTSKGIGAAVVVDGPGNVVGIVSERDIVHHIASHEGKAPELEVGELMATQIVACSPEDNIKHVMGLMTHRRMRHLPVMEHGNLCGIVSIGDVVKAHLDEKELEIGVLRDLVTARAVA